MMEKSTGPRLIIQMDAAQWVGTREEQQDYVNSSRPELQDELGVLCVLADGMGGLTGGLLALLLALEGPFASHSAFSGQFSGASLLTDSVGSYVLAAVIAFTVGVGLTLGISRYREKKQHAKEEEEV